MDKAILAIIIIGAINWGCIGIFGADIIGSIFGGQGSAISRIIFTIVGFAGLWSLTLFRKLSQSS